MLGEWGSDGGSIIVTNIPLCLSTWTLNSCFQEVTKVIALHPLCEREPSAYRRVTVSIYPALVIGQDSDLFKMSSFGLSILSLCIRLLVLYFPKHIMCYYIQSYEDFFIVDAFNLSLHYYHCFTSRRKVLIKESPLSRSPLLQLSLPSLLTTGFIFIPQ